MTYPLWTNCRVVPYTAISVSSNVAEPFARWHFTPLLVFAVAQSCYRRRYTRRPSDPTNRQA